MVRVTHGNLGVTEEITISAEFIVFFVKMSTVVVATSEKSSEIYHIPLNSSLQFAQFMMCLNALRKMDCLYCYTSIY